MSPREQQVESFVRAQPDGVTKHRVAAMLGVPVTRAAKVLHEARKAGAAIDSTEISGPLARWCAVELKDALRDRFRVEGRTAKNIAQASRMMAKRDKAAGAWPAVAAGMPSRRIVSSVWDLAR